MTQFTKEFGSLRKAMLQIWTYLKVLMNLIMKSSCGDDLDVLYTTSWSQLDLYATKESQIKNSLKINGMLWLCVIIIWNRLKDAAKMDSVFSIKMELGFSKISPALKFGENLSISKARKCFQCPTGEGNALSYVMLVQKMLIYSTVSCYYFEDRSLANHRTITTR